ncbi:PREDICTED: decaprenyl-diphosphate synthase subunit 2 [Polistes dominula]|uniref:Decaprenyl-diphosphate synthase subunit 2 n=1 Tax=Polistes dominula TaxID=743375 RepID=A0ABM1HXG7_POLDO|nr:PREDICTED: decaprenyl-diphosphate synthase subunit 2 [Polistes dominula]
MSKNKFALTLLKNDYIMKSLCRNKYNVVLTIKKNIHSSREKYIRLDERCMLAAKPIVSQKPDWNKAVSEAEKIVGYPTSFLSLRWLLSDEIANVALHLRKLVGSNHPLLSIAKDLIYNGRHNMQAWGLIVLLISKAAGHLNVNDMEEDKAAGVLHSQRALAEITEMIRTSHLMHKSIVHISPDMYPEICQSHDISFGNKIALLSGDYLLCNSCVELASLRNQDIVELMSIAIKDVVESEFLGRRDKQNNPLPRIPPSNRKGYAVKEWTLKNVLSAGSLLGKSCQGTLKLAGHNADIQNHGHEFGKHLALAWQACLDVGIFTAKESAASFNLCSAPVMFHIEHDPSILTEIDKGLESVDNVDYAKVRSIVSQGPGIELTKQLQKKHSQKATEVLDVFQESDARKALCNIVAAIGDF